MRYWMTDDSLVKSAAVQDSPAVSENLAVKTSAAAGTQGIPDPWRYGDPRKLKSGDLVPFSIQQHDARRAGFHRDVRIGRDKMLSWATRKPLPEPGKRTQLFSAPVHDESYASFEGTLPSGYGAGTVKREDLGKALILTARPDLIKFVVAHRENPQEFTLVRLKDPSGKKPSWLMINSTPNKPVPYEKIHYAKIPAEEIDRLMDPKFTMSAKIDGSSALVNLLKDKIHVLSYRQSAEGKPIVHTWRIPQLAGRRIQVPKDMIGTTLRGELYGTRKGKSIPASELGGILNSTVENALNTQRATGTQLRVALFDVLSQRDKPWSQRRKTIQNALMFLPNDTFEEPPYAVTPEEKQKMWSDIITGDNPLTHEGVVGIPEVGNPTKVKIRPEADVVIRDIFPGGGRLAGKGAGGFGYSLTPGSQDVVGRVGSGFSESDRQDMLRNPGRYLGRMARIQSQGQFPSGAHRAPVYIARHEDLSPVKSAAELSIGDNSPKVAISGGSSPHTVTTGAIGGGNLPNTATSGVLPNGNSGTTVASKRAELLPIGNQIPVKSAETCHEIQPICCNALHGIQPTRCNAVLLGGLSNTSSRLMGVDKLAAMRSDIPLQMQQERVLQRLRNEPGALVYHALGSGKTRASIAAGDEFGPTSVVLPASLRENYKKEIGKWTTLPPTQRQYRIQSYNDAVAHGTPRDVGLTVFDEAHRMGREGTESSQLPQNAAGKIMLLTGTPVRNDPSELAPLLHAISADRGAPETQREFRQKFVRQDQVGPGLVGWLMGVKPGMIEHLDNERQLRKLLRNRVDYFSGQSTAPDVTEKNINVEMTPDQTDMYNATLTGHPLLRYKMQHNLPPTRAEALMLNSFLSASRQISNDPAAFQPDLESDPLTRAPKLQRATQELVKFLDKNPRAKALVYSTFLRAGVTPVEHELKARGVPYASFIGGMPDDERKRIVDSYNKNKIRALLVSGAGAEGLDLKGTRLVQLLEPHWNEARMDQVIGRAVRQNSHTQLPPEERNVLVQRFLAKPRPGWMQRMGLSRVPTSTDEYIRNRSKDKQRLINELLKVLQEEGVKPPEGIAL